MKTSELQGAALDWAVAKLTNPEWTDEDRWHNTIGYLDTGDEDDEPYQPSINWAQGGPIIERERIHLAHSHAKGHWVAFIANSEFGNVFGPTPLVAAMRCYVASKLGDEVVLPEELK